MNDLRRFVQIIESIETDNKQLNEAGGLVDKILAKLPGSTGAAAQGRVDKKKIFNMIKKAWIKYAASSDLNKKDAYEVAQFLVKHIGLDVDEVRLIKGISKDPINLNEVFIQAAALVSKKVGPEFSQKSDRSPSSSRSRRNNDTDYIMDIFRKKLQGNMRSAKAYAMNRKNFTEISNKPLALIGLEFLRSNKMI